MPRTRLPTAAAILAPLALQSQASIATNTPATRQPLTNEPISDPEPARPSLDEPDPGIFHHNPTRPPQ